MEQSLKERFKHAWNVFRNKDPAYWRGSWDQNVSYYRPDRRRRPVRNEQTIVNAILNRIALDVASVKLVHARLDDNKRYVEDVKSTLNECLTVEANLDQTGRDFVHDIALSLLDEGSIAVVPTDVNEHTDSGKIDILTMRVGKILEWMPKHVRVRIYNENTGKTEEVVVPKRFAAIMENPFYSVMNEPNSTLQRLLRKLAILDVIDEQSGSGKLDLIIQLPYSVRSELRRNQAEERRKDLERQLAGSKYGIGYIDGTEHITQLNRAVENNLLKQIEYLTSILYGQLGVTEEIMNSSADEKTMLNYNNRLIEPILSEITDEMTRKFIRKEERDKGEVIMFFNDPFRLVPVSDIAEIADKFTRNEILTSNEIRQLIAMKPSDDPNADELRNKNLSQSKELIKEKLASGELSKTVEKNQNERSLKE